MFVSMQNFTDKTACLDAMMTFVASCALVKVEAVDVHGKVCLICCEIDTRKHVARVLKTRGLQRVCFRVSDRLDKTRKQVFLWDKK